MRIESEVRHVRNVVLDLVRTTQRLFELLPAELCDGLPEPPIKLVQ